MNHELHNSGTENGNSSWRSCGRIWKKRRKKQTYFAHSSGLFRKALRYLAWMAG